MRLEYVLKKEDGLSDLAFRKEPSPEGVPSSGSVERTFSTEKDVLCAIRATLSDANIERLVFVMGKQHLIGDKWYASETTDVSMLSVRCLGGFGGRSAFSVGLGLL